MAIPDFEGVMLPLVEILGDGKEHPTKDLTQAISDRFNLTEDERQRMLPSGNTRVIVNRVGWAKHYLKNSGLAEQPKRGVVQITDEGRKLLAEKPSRIDAHFLERYPAYQKYMQRCIKSRKGSGDTSTTITLDPKLTPEELLENSYQTLRNALANELLDQIKSCSPEFFERLVVELLVAMGYGGSIEDAGQTVGYRHALVLCHSKILG